MKKMLKTAAVLAAMVMALTLGACSNDDDGGSGDGSGSGSGSGNTPNTPSNENPFGFTEKDSNNYFCLDKDGIVLQKVEYPAAAKDVKGTVFLVYWTLTDGRGNVQLRKYYGNDEDVTIPDGVTEIGGFSGCSSLASVTIPDSATKIGDYAFSGCTSLESVTIPDGVTTIDWEAFKGCTSLASVTIPGSVTKIGKYAFQDCTSLESVTIPGSVTEIGQYAFQDCTSLASVTISDGVTTIGQYAFYDCSSLASVTIPGSVTKISQYAFYDCPNIETVNYTGTLKQWCEMDNDLYLMMKVKNIKMPNGTNLKTETQLVIPEGATKIGVLAFDGCTSLASVSIPASVTSIAEYAFRNCGQANAFEVSFAVQNGWYANSHSGGYSSYQIDVSDPSKNGKYLRSSSVFPTTDGTDWNIRGIYRETE